MNEKEQDTAKKPSPNRSAKERRNTLFRVLDGVSSLSHRKIHSDGNSDRAKQGWTRVLVSAVSTYGSLVKDWELKIRMKRYSRECEISANLPFFSGSVSQQSSIWREELVSTYLNYFAWQICLFNRPSEPVHLIQR